MHDCDLIAGLVTVVPDRTEVVDEAEAVRIVHRIPRVTPCGLLDKCSSLMSCPVAMACVNVRTASRVDTIAPAPCHIEGDVLVTSWCTSPTPIQKFGPASPPIW